MKKDQKKTIGDWLSDLGDATLRPNAWWTVVADGHTTHAVVFLRILVIRNGNVVAQTMPGAVARGSDWEYSSTTWEPQTDAAAEADKLLRRVEEHDYSNLPYRRFWGVNRAMPWEIPPPPAPPKPSLWRRFIARLTFWKGGAK